MKERPIIFSTPMVRAILRGSKTQTRRELRHQLSEDFGRIVCGHYHPTVIDRHGDEQPGKEIFGAYSKDGEWACKCPYGQPGDQLWVRESLAYDAEYGHYYAATERGSLGNASGRTYLCSLFDTDDGGYSYDGKMPDRSIPSIHMPRRYSRIQLEITGVRVERLQDISEQDALAEGIERDSDGWFDYQMPQTQRCIDPRESYRTLFESINGAGSWVAHPWVWVIEFRSA